MITDPTNIQEGIERFIASAADEEGPSCCADWFTEVETLLRKAPSTEETCKRLASSLREVLIRWRNADEAYHNAADQAPEPVATETQTHKDAERALKEATMLGLLP